MERIWRAMIGAINARTRIVITTMATDLSFPVSVHGMPIVREADGLALSSRNVRLSANHRRSATALSAGLLAAADAFEAGEQSEQRSEVVGLGRRQEENRWVSG